MNETDTEILMLQTVQLNLTVQQGLSMVSRQVKATIDSLIAVSPDFAAEYAKRSQSFPKGTDATHPSLDENIASALSRIELALKALEQKAGRP